MAEVLLPRSVFSISQCSTVCPPLLQVFVYVMHSKKAQVPKEEYEAIRQCQQEERERKKQGLKPPWHQMNQHMTPPTIPPRATPPTGLSEYTPQEPGTSECRNDIH